LPLLLPSRVITRSGSTPARGGPPLGGRAGERSECFFALTPFMLSESCSFYFLP